MIQQYREKKYTCGDYLEVDLYPVFSKQRGRAKKAKPTDEVQKRLNLRNAENILHRLLITNFTADDLKCELTYAPDAQPRDVKQAQRDLQNFMRRLKRLRKKKGLPPLKYVQATEKGSRTERYHHHIVINGGISPKELAEVWGKGFVRKIQPLQFDECGLMGIAKYFTKAPLAYKSWSASRNLIQPEPKERTGRIPAKKVREMVSDNENRFLFENLYPGYTFAQCENIYNDVNGGYYLRIRMYNAAAVFGAGTKKKRQTDDTQRCG